MSRPVVYRPESLCDSSPSISECPCCASTPLPDLETLDEDIPDCRLDTLGLVSKLEGQFQDSVSFQSATEFSIQAAAIVPHDQQANDQWLLVNLLCHRVFDECGDHARIRNFSMFYYKKLGPGDVLTAVSRKVIRDRLTWLEATVTRGGVLVAIAIVLYDDIHSDTVDDIQVQEVNQR